MKNQNTAKEEKVLEKLKKVIDPELGVNIVDLGLIYKIKALIDTVEIDMTLTAPFCPLRDMLVQQVEEEVGKIRGVKKVKVNLVFHPPWSPEKMDPFLFKKLELGK